MRDTILHEWVCGLPGDRSVVVVSLLGKKPKGKNEWSYYSFYETGRSFQDWLDQHYKEKAIQVIEHQTCDMRPIPNTVLMAVSFDIMKLLCEARTIVLMDSGGEVRVQQVCKYMGAVCLNRV